MKLKNYRELFEEIDPKDWGEDDDDLYGRPHYSSKDDDYEELKRKFNETTGEDFDDEDPDFDVKSNPVNKSKHEEDDVESDIPDEDMKHLLYLLRTFFKNSGIDADIESKDLDIMIYIVLNKKEKMKNLLKVFDVVKKLKRDILPQYDSEFELWETKTDDPMLTFNFAYEGDDGDPNHDGKAPF